MDIPETITHFRTAFRFCFAESGFRSQKALAQAAGVSESAVCEINKSKSYGPGTQAKIARAFGYDLLDFLSLGKRLNQGKEAGRPFVVTVQSEKEKKLAGNAEIQYRAVPLYASGKLAAGEKGMVFDPYENPDSSILIDHRELTGRRHHNLVSLRVGGDSMSPLIPPGSTVVIDLDDRDFIHNKIYAVNYPAKGENIAAVKRVQQWKKGFVLISHSADYPPELTELDWRDLCVGRVVWLWKSLENV